MTAAIVVMGPSGCGKTTVARALASELGWPYLEGDDFHSPANRQKMAAGRALDDADREPWLASIAAAIPQAQHVGVVVACSALKRRYRDVLRSCGASVTFVLPEVPREVLSVRLAQRAGHFMPPSLLDSQLGTLEPLGPDEAGFTIDGTSSPAAQVADIRSRLDL